MQDENSPTLTTGWPSSLRCLITGNSCGTDTWQVGHPCKCSECQAWLGMECIRVTGQSNTTDTGPIKGLNRPRWRQQPHAAREFIRLFVEALTKHRKRGNRHLPPLGVVKSWRMAQCGRAIVLGPPYRLRWMGYEDAK